MMGELRSQRPGFPLFDCSVLETLMAGKPTILAVTEKRSIFGILCAILIKDFDVLCTDGFDLDAKSAAARDAESVIVDLEITRIDPIGLIEQLNGACPSLRLVGLVTVNGRHLIDQAKMAGARDVVLIPDDLDRLPSLIRSGP
jgi:DNA-binding NtrC family response regulator